MNFKNITISGKICTGKSTLRNLLIKKLKNGWTTFSTGELFRQYVKENNLSLEQADEQNNKLSKKIDNQVKTLLKTKEKLIIDSWMAGITAKGIKDVLKVLLVCKDDIRYKRFAKREKLNYQTSKKMVDERLQNWAKKIKEIYHRDDFYDEKLFDLIIDTSYVTPQAVLKKVIEKLK